MTGRAVAPDNAVAAVTPRYDDDDRTPPTDAPKPSDRRREHPQTSGTRHDDGGPRFRGWTAISAGPAEGGHLPVEVGGKRTGAHVVACRNDDADTSVSETTR